MHTHVIFQKSHFIPYISSIYHITSIHFILCYNTIDSQEITFYTEDQRDCFHSVREKKKTFHTVLAHRKL